MPLTDDDIKKLAAALRSHHDCPLADPEAKERHDKHHGYIDVVMEREAERTAVRRAVIEKSLAGLVWSGMAALGAAVWTYMKNHIK